MLDRMIGRRFNIIENELGDLESSFLEKIFDRMHLAGFVKKLTDI